jgi:excisionase family DNA binding protein
MSNEHTFLTTFEAAKLEGCTSRHITNLITRGELSATRKDNKYYIDKSEFYRVFPDAIRKEKEPTHLLSENTRLSFENSMLKDACKSKDREIEFLRSQIESFDRKIERMMESSNSLTRLLEHSNKPKDNSNANKGWNIFRKKK